MRNTSARARVDNAHPFRSSLTSSIKPPRAFLSFLQTRSSLLSHAAIFPPSRLLVRIKIFAGKRAILSFWSGIDQSGWNYWPDTWVSWMIFVGRMEIRRFSSGYHPSNAFLSIYFIDQLRSICILYVLLSLYVDRIYMKISK